RSTSLTRSSSLRRPSPCSRWSSSSYKRLRSRRRPRGKRELRRKRRGDVPWLGCTTTGGVQDSRAIDSLAANGPERLRLHGRRAFRLRILDGSPNDDLAAAQVRAFHFGDGRIFALADLGVEHDSCAALPVGAEADGLPVEHVVLRFRVRLRLARVV